MAKVKLKPGWLSDTVHDAVLSIRANHDKAVADMNYRFIGGTPDEYPISWDDADELAARMSVRFKTWTGRTLEQHFAARSR